MGDHFIRLRVVYDDLPDLIDLGVLVRCGDWSANSTAYTGPADFARQARSLLEWCASPAEPITIGTGADTGVGWMMLKFYPVDLVGHLCCAITLATRETASHRPESTWRFAVEMPTELGSVERFARHCIAITEDFTREALLLCMRS